MLWTLWGGALRGPMFHPVDDMLCTMMDACEYKCMYIHMSVNYWGVCTPKKRKVFGHYMRGKLSTSSQRFMRCRVTTLHEDSIGAYKKWLRQDVIFIIK